MGSTLNSSILLVSSADRPKNNNFGTAFLIGRDSSVIFVVTCAHVITEVGGPEKVMVATLPATVVAISPDETANDLAVLQVEVPHKVGEPLTLNLSGAEGMPFSAAGYQRGPGQRHTVRHVRGKLGQPIEWEANGQRVAAWDLIVLGPVHFQHGYSGAPVIKGEDSSVLAVATHRLDEGKTGMAIATTALVELWPESWIADADYRSWTATASGHELVREELVEASQVVLDRPERNFANQLARLYPTLSAVEQLIAVLAGRLTISAIEGPLPDRCRKVVRAAIDHGRMEDLIRIVSKQNPRDGQWIDSILAYREHVRTRRHTVRAGSEQRRDPDEVVIDQSLTSPLTMAYVTNLQRCLSNLQRLFHIIRPDHTSSRQQIDVTLTPVKLGIWDLKLHLERVADVAELPGIESDAVAVQLRNDLRIANRLYGQCATAMQELTRSGPASVQRDALINRYQSKSEKLLKQLWKTHDTFGTFVRRLTAGERSSG